MRWVQQRGAYSSSGRTTAERIAKLSMPYAHALTNDGGIARKKQDFLEVTGADPSLYVLATSSYNETTLLHTTYYRGGAGNFAKGGTVLAAATDAGASGYVFPLTFYGGGRAEYTRLEKTPNQWLATPWYGNLDQFAVVSYSSTDGKAFKRTDLGQLVTGNAYNTAPVQNMGGGWVGPPYAFHNERCALTVNSTGQVRIVYSVRAKGITSAYYPEDPNWRQAMRPGVQRAGANSRLMLRRYVYSAQATGQAADGLPPLQFSWSNDAGVTWTPRSIPEFDTPVAALIARVNSAAPINVDRTNYLNPVVQAVSFRIAPMTAYFGLITIVVPYHHEDAAALNGFSIQARVVTGVIDLSSGYVSSVATVYDSMTDTVNASGGYGYAQYFVHDLTPVAGGVVVTTIPHPLLATGQPNYASLRTMQFTSNGLSFSGAHTMPGSTGFMGRVAASSPHVLMCAMFDGAYSLYSTKDNGANWVRVCTIAKVADVAAPPGNTWSMLQFVYLLRLLTAAGLPAAQTAAVPWATDARITPH
jgi:hypothetical protein